MASSGAESTPAFFRRRAYSVPIPSIMSSSARFTQSEMPRLLMPVPALMAARSFSVPAFFKDIFHSLNAMLFEFGGTCLVNPFNIG